MGSLIAFGKFTITASYPVGALKVRIYIDILLNKTHTISNKVQTIINLISRLPLSPDSGNRRNILDTAICRVDEIMNQYNDLPCDRNDYGDDVDSWIRRVVQFIEDLNGDTEGAKAWGKALKNFRDIRVILVNMRLLEQSRLDLEASTRENAMEAFEDVAGALRPLDAP